MKRAAPQLRSIANCSHPGPMIAKAATEAIARNQEGMSPADIGSTYLATSLNPNGYGLQPNRDPEETTPLQQVI